MLCMGARLLGDGAFHTTFIWRLMTQSNATRLLTSVTTLVRFLQTEIARFYSERDCFFF
jgi:hypothetical protein